MGFTLAFLKRGLPLAALASAAMISARAQGLGSRSGEAILFSSPAGDSADSTNLPSLTPKPSEALDLEGITQAPENFNFSQPRGVPLLPYGMPPISPGENSRLQDLRRNWVLLTPAEILGAATPEKMMGVLERDALGQPKNLTALERYTERQNQIQLRLARTNALLAGDASSSWNLSGDSYRMSNSLSSGWRNADYMTSPLFDSTPDRQAPGRQNEKNTWSKLFDQPAALPTPNLAQPTDMERFRQLLNPGSSSITPVAAAASDGLKTSLPQTMLGSSLAQSSTPRIGTSYTPFSKPPELPKLPAAWNVGFTSTPPAAAWSPQQAPWLSPGPQPFVAPQRKF